MTVVISKTIKPVHCMGVMTFKLRGHNLGFLIAEHGKYDPYCGGVGIDELFLHCALSLEICIFQNHAGEPD